MMKETRGSDFTGYKRTTLQRRVKRRMILLDLAAFAEYKDYLELQPEEFGQLFDSLLINVTGFFRDPLAWQALREQVLPELFSAKGVKTPIRVWSAGCATGEDAYTLAIVLAEALGHDQFRERVKIYATDLDEDALQQARAGAYDASALADVPEKLRDTYFEPVGEKHVFRRDLRRQVIFGRNDLTHDAPISRVDLLVARNTLMYFNAEAQASVIRRFHFALSYPGYLFLGKAEMLLNHTDDFQPVDLRKRLFRKVSPTVLTDFGYADSRSEPAASRPPSSWMARPCRRGRWCSSRSISLTSSRWPTRRPSHCSTCVLVTWGARFPSSKCPTGPPSSDPASSRSRPSCGRRSCTTSNGSGREAQIRVTTMSPSCRCSAHPET